MSAEGQIFTIENLCKLLHMSGKKNCICSSFAVVMCMKGCYNTPVFTLKIKRENGTAAYISAACTHGGNDGTGR